MTPICGLGGGGLGGGGFGAGVVEVAGLAAVVLPPSPFEQPLKKPAASKTTAKNILVSGFGELIIFNLLDAAFKLIFLHA